MHEKRKYFLILTHRSADYSSGTDLLSRVVRTPGKPGTPGIILEFHLPSWKNLENLEFQWNPPGIHYLTASKSFDQIL